MLKPPGTNRLKVKYDSLLPNYAVNFNFRRYSVVLHEHVRLGDHRTGNGWRGGGPRDSWCSRGGRGLHSSTFRLIVSAFYGIGGNIQGMFR